MQPLVTPEALADIRRRVEARGITVPDQIDWDAIDNETRTEWAESRLQIRQQVWRDQVPEDYDGASVDDFADLTVDLRGHETTVAAAIRSWLPYHDRNLILAGSTGVGKTRAAYAVGYALLDLACSPYAITAPDLLDSFRPNRKAQEQDWVLDSDVLIIDDLGTDKTTDWADETWWRVVNYRAAQKKPMIITTNLTSDEMRAKYGNRIVSRLLAHAPLILRLTGPDRRAKF